MKVVDLKGELYNDYGARIVATLENKRKYTFELSCGQLGAFDKDVHNDPKANFDEYKMNWNHIIELSTKNKTDWKPYQ